MVFATRLLFFLFLLFAVKVMAQNLGQEDEETMDFVYGSEDMISLATGKQKPVPRAPAVATVITAEDIKEIGATDLDEVLETIPGLHVARAPQGYNPIYSFRGIFSQFNPQVLVLINGIPITNLFHGDRNQIWGGMPLQAISRIEVIRGPGSAIYGADAFAGVINVITKTKQDIKGTEVGVRAGSFSTWDAWALHGGSWGGFDIAVMLEYGDTNGQREIIDADAQTFFDDVFGTNASLAPGPVNLQRENFDARLDITREHWRLRAGLQRRRNFETGAGVAEALDPNGQFASDRWNVDLTYHNPEFFTKNWDVMAQLSYLDTTQEVQQDVRLFPPGADFGAVPGVDFPEGVIGNPEVFERHARFNISAFYKGFDKHQLRVGTGFYYGDLYKVKETKNFLQDPITGLPQPLGSLRDVTGDLSLVFLREENRKNYYFFMQEVWNFANDWELTAGLRYDHFSDFGHTVNPRLALVWLTRYNLTTKFLYGRAFRAPSFAELFNINNPVTLGNPDLDPETIETIELAFDYRPTDELHFALSLFHYQWDDIIQFVSEPGVAGHIARNAGEQTGFGMELEADWGLTDDFHLLGNYAFQQSTDEKTDENAGNAPHHQIYLRADWEFLPDWHLNPQLNWIIDRSRVAGDNRLEIDDYSIFDLTLRRMVLKEHWEIAFSVRNLFDSDAREPSPVSSPKTFIPHDLPLAGRSFFGEVRLRF
ncbi:TonB-dependent receptor [Nitrosococcus halophilus Nc 4]|uniref:TonB-dependent receptor n=2 Tax=Nitrosococcus halophilus TaxID=133539 RepID=D5C0Z8_NITHN|nr:TonB-dependent receptor [Nitrosococcus halophilus Nc 4]